MPPQGDLGQPYRLLEDVGTVLTRLAQLARRLTELTVTVTLLLLVVRR